MKSKILLYVGSIVIILWGVAHIVPTKSVVEGFGSITRENQLIITMEWVAEGLTLCFIGLLVLYVTLRVGLDNRVRYECVADRMIVIDTYVLEGPAGWPFVSLISKESTNL